MSYETPSVSTRAFPGRVRRSQLVGWAVEAEVARTRTEILIPIVGESGSATDPEERWFEVEKPVRRNKSISPLGVETRCRLHLHLYIKTNL